MTIQVPVYNERYVIARLLEALGHLDYPRNLYQVQVLDDSTDETSGIIKTAAGLLSAKGIQVSVIHRSDRQGYKAGALQVGLAACETELISIFDADFIPPADFLKKMVGYFHDDNVGGVQARWIHENLHQNPLTIIQAYLLDSHFNLEQTGRAAGGYFLNFNGTAGIWRRQCIIDSGGWNGSVLTEDLELSYRAQLRGWKFMYNNDMAVPAELPDDMIAFKTQQFRWAKGMAQTAAKHLKSVSAFGAGPVKKIHAVYHLLSSVSFLAIMGNMILAIPILAARNYYPEFRNLSNILLCTGITLPVLFVYYYFGTRPSLSRKVFWTYLPVFLTVYMALAVQNSVAVIQGLAGHSSPFVRTPKSSGRKTHEYSSAQWSAINWLELFMLLYAIAGIIMSFYWGDYFLISFLLMVLAGLAMIVFPSISRLFMLDEKMKPFSRYSDFEQA